MIEMFARLTLLFVFALFSLNSSARDFSTNEEVVLGAYLAYYGRPGDPEGLAYWSNRLANEGGDINSIITAFGESDEYQQRFGSLNSTELVTNLFLQMFGRQPDSGGLNFYVGKLDTGEWSLQRISLAILNGVQGDDITVVDNKLAFSKVFVDKIELGEAEQPSAEALADVIAGIDETSESLDDAYAVMDNGFASTTQNLSALDVLITNGETRIGYSLDLSITLEAQEPEEEVGLVVFAIDLKANKQIPIGAKSIEALSAGTNNVDMDVELPLSLNEGAYYIAVFLDGGDEISETDEKDNDTSVYVDLDPAATAIDLSLDLWTLESQVLPLDTTTYEELEGGFQNSDANGTLEMSVRGNAEPVDVEAFAYLRLKRSDGGPSTGGGTDGGPIYYKPSPADDATHIVPLYLWNSDEARYMNAYKVDIDGNATDEEWLPLGLLEPQEAGQSGDELVLEDTDNKSAHLDLYLPGRLAKEIEVSARNLIVTLSDPTFPPPDLSYEEISALNSFLYRLPHSTDIDNPYDEGPAFEVLSADVCVEIRPSNPDVVDRETEDNVSCSPVAMSLPPVPPLPPLPEYPPYSSEYSVATNPVFFNEEYAQTWGSSTLGIGLSLYANAGGTDEGLYFSASSEAPLNIIGQSTRFAFAEADAFVGYDTKEALAKTDEFNFTIGALDQVIYNRSLKASDIDQELTEGKTYSYSKSRQRTKYFTIGPVPVVVDLLAMGTVGVKLEMKLLGTRHLDATVTPFVNAYGTASAEAGAGITAGVYGQLTLIDDKLTINPSLAATVTRDATDNNGYTVAVNIRPSLKVENELTGMSGLIQGFVAIYLPTLVECDWGFFTGVCPGLYRANYYKNFAKWVGWYQKDVLLDISTDIEIVTIDGDTNYYEPGS